MPFDQEASDLAAFVAIALGIALLWAWLPLLRWVLA